MTCIMGPSGTGKTTLLYLLAGLYTPSSGEILDVPADPVILFQEDRLLPWFNVRRNLLLVCEDQRKVEEM
ncbi:MAG: ATP-binding cassette domain-containing protein, partial [Lachnospiraceae bacterium]|nr:ATP-binding cassette domain-containing protein [Lachnospiraceae bacterium]